MQLLIVFLNWYYKINDKYIHKFNKLAVVH